MHFIANVRAALSEKRFPGLNRRPPTPILSPSIHPAVPSGKAVSQRAPQPSARGIPPPRFAPLPRTVAKAGSDAVCRGSQRARGGKRCRSREGGDHLVHGHVFFASVVGMRAGGGGEREQIRPSLWHKPSGIQSTCRFLAIFPAKVDRALHKNGNQTLKTKGRAAVPFVSLGSSSPKWRRAAGIRGGVICVMLAASLARGLARRTSRRGQKAGQDAAGSVQGKGGSSVVWCCGQRGFWWC